MDFKWSNNNGEDSYFQLWGNFNMHIMWTAYKSKLFRGLAVTDISARFFGIKAGSQSSNLHVIERQLSKYMRTALILYMNQHERIKTYKFLCK